MNESSYEIAVKKDLQDLIPAFMENRRQELGLLEGALAAADFERLRRIAHRMKGVGEPYGFTRISSLGTEVVEAIDRGDLDAVDAYIAVYRDYLSRVKINFE